jgi:hypothetical protein
MPPCRRLDDCIYASGTRHTLTCERLSPENGERSHQPVTAFLIRRTDLSRIRRGHTSTWLLVGRPGLEPGTLGLKVPCSTR